MIRSVVLLGGFLLSLGTACADWQELQSMKPGTPILVNSGFVSDAGKLVRTTPDALSIETRTGQVTVAKDDIDEVFVFRTRPDRIRSGLLWGGIAAGVTAAVVFPVASSLTKPQYLTSALVTATNGTSIGIARIASSKVKRIYQRGK